MKGSRRNCSGCKRSQAKPNEQRRSEQCKTEKWKKFQEQEKEVY